MPLYLALFMVTYSILVACISFVAVCWFLSRRKRLFFKEILMPIIPGIDWFGAETEKEIEGLIDERLNAIIVGFKKQIPMIGMFLSQTKEEALKTSAKVELMRLIPAIKKRFLQKIGESDYLEGQFHLIVSQLVSGLWRRVKYQLFSILVGVGALLGILEVLLFSGFTR